MTKRTFKGHCLCKSVRYFVAHINPFGHLPPDLAVMRVRSILCLASY